VGLRELIESWRKIIMLASKPDKEELLLSIKIIFLGFTIVGVISFIIKYIASILKFAP